MVLVMFWGMTPMIVTVVMTVMPVIGRTLVTVIVMSATMVAVAMAVMTGTVICLS